MSAYKYVTLVLLFCFSSSAGHIFHNKIWAVDQKWVSLLWEETEADSKRLSFRSSGWTQSPSTTAGPSGMLETNLVIGCKAWKHKVHQNLFCFLQLPLHSTHFPSTLSTSHFNLSLSLPGCLLFWILADFLKFLFYLDLFYIPCQLFTANPFPSVPSSLTHKLCEIILLSAHPSIYFHLLWLTSLSLSPSIAVCPYFLGFHSHWNPSFPGHPSLFGFRSLLIVSRNSLGGSAVSELDSTLPTQLIHSDYICGYNP